MDPVGSWSAYAASYNRLAGAAGSNGDFPHHLPATNPAPSTSTNSPLLLQAAHATSSPAFTHGSFLSPPPVGYDTVFSPFLHHANQKAHYTQALNVAQHRQAIATSKQENDSIRENYSPAHPQALSAPNPAFFEQAPGAVQPSAITWTHQGNSHTQLPSPFGILPHESVVGGNANGPVGKIPYENINAAHFAAAQTLNHINSQLVAVSYNDTTRRLAPRPVQSPPSKNATVIVTTSSGYFQQSSPSPSSQFSTNTQPSPTKVDFYSTSGVAGPVHKTQVHNVMSTATTNQAQPSSGGFSSRNLEKQPGAFQSPSTKSATSTSSLPSKINDRRDSGHESTQSSPISYAMLESPQHRSIPKIPPSRTGIPVQQSQLQQQLLSHHKTGSYRGAFSSNTATPEAEYNQGSAGRSSSSTDAGYSSGSSVGPGGVDAAMQRSPLDSHVTSPTAYPVYHSPMTSMSSPSPVQQHGDQNGSYKQNPSPQVTPTSPLDASLPRHPSVIIRGDQNYPNDNLPHKQSWETTEQLRTKYSTYSTDISQNPSSVAIQQQRPPFLATDRQQGYFDTNSQNLISVKGDPMTIVKNLHSLQQQCQAPPIAGVDIKPCFDQSKPIVKSTRSPAKRKKSVDSKGSLTHPDPPPAHGNVNQLQQNAGFTEFDKWNMRQPPKILNGTGSPTFGAHNTFTNVNSMNPNLISQPVQQTIDEVAAYSSHTMPSTNEQKYMNPEQQQQNSAAVPHPSQYNDNVTPAKFETTIAKVIVPDVEAELDFLAEEPKSNEKNLLSHTPVMNRFCSNPNKSFMESYLKFLHGGKESSPPPRRNPRKSAYIPPPKGAQLAIKETKKHERKNKSPSPSPDFENDPRYFPLPKDPASRKLKSSDSEETDYENLIPTTMHEPGSNSNSNVQDHQQSKRKSIRKKDKTKNQRSKRRKQSSSDNESDKDVPQRRTSKRKAKEKISCFDEIMDELISGKSSSDSAWSPAEASDEDGFSKRWNSRRRQKNSKAKKPPPSRFLESSDEEQAKQKPEETDVAGLCPVCNCNFAEDPKDAVKCSACRKQYHTGCCSLQTMQRLQKLGSRRSSWKCDGCKSSGSKSGEKKRAPRKNGQSRKGRRGSRSAKFMGNDGLDSSLGTEEYFPFKSGEFIVVKDDLKEEYPPIWRVDGKTLLQKYEPFDQNGERMYRNISTYSGWTPQNRDIYQKVPVQFIVQSRYETIVRFLRSEMVDPAIEQAYLEQSLNETAKYQDNFEVYIQTLISQALDANFLAEIFAEKDEYFLQNVEVIDRVTEVRRQRLVAAADWPSDSALQRGVATWPCYNVLADLKSGPVPTCNACERGKVHARILLYGQPYNPTTLDGVPPRTEDTENKDFMICLECIKHVQLYNKLVHQKYIMYIECAKRVLDKRSKDTNKDTTVILNELLADEQWLYKLFQQVRVVWADVERTEREKKIRLGIPLEPPKKASAVTDCVAVNITNVQSDVETDVVVEKEFVREIKVERESEAEEEEVNDENINLEAEVVTREEESAQPAEAKSPQLAEDRSPQPVKELNSQLTEDGSLQPAEKLSSQPREDGSLQLAEELSSQPIEDGSLQPAGELSSQLTEDGSLQPAEELSSLPGEVDRRDSCLEGVSIEEVTNQS